MTNAIELARTLYAQDAANGTPAASGWDAYTGWLNAARTHGDHALAYALSHCDEDAFVAAWESLAETATTTAEG